MSEFEGEDCIQFWLERIREADAEEEAGRTNYIEATIKKGWILLEAKKAMGHGNFRKLFKKGGGPLPYDISTAQRYMKIAKDPVFGHPKYRHPEYEDDDPKTARVRLLPTSLMARYELAGVEDAVVKAEWFRTGVIHPDLTSEDAKRLGEGKKPKDDEKDDEDEDEPDVGDVPKLLNDLSATLYRLNCEDPEELAKRILEQSDQTTASFLRDAQKLNAYAATCDQIQKMIKAWISILEK